ncbi:MAG TPA: protein translocase subunit SecD [Anaerolineaceae bacterium]|nr:protein translocase subunit SecD [Anaerolineaceae bacterium]
MSQRKYINLGIIILILAAAIWINVPSSSIKIGKFQRDLDVRLGLDLRGGLQVLLEADLPAETEVNPDQLEVARQIMENRANALGVEENSFQTAGSRRLVGEFPGATNIDEVISSIQATGLLEFVDFGTVRVPEGTIIKTDYGQASSDGSQAQTTPEASSTEAATPEATTAPTQEGTPAADATATPAAEDAQVYHTVMAGSMIKEVGVQMDQLGTYYVVTFVLTDEGKQIFSEYTTSHVGQYLGIVLDKKVVESPSIKTPITGGSGEIEGQFTSEGANNLAVQLRYGSLPIPLKIVESQVIGPSLGEDSLQKSILAGAIGFAIIILFMAMYYRLPGGIADLAIIFYALITLAIFRLIPVTLTLPGIAGVMLSTGSALDANILIFERLKEELRAGKTVGQALPLAFSRAWPSIRDSNIATLITSLILFWFGSSFGASIVKGFAITLALGVLVSLFTALFVTRTFLSLMLERVKPTNYAKWFGI